MTINLDNLPRTIELIRADESFPGVPSGFPILKILDQTKLPKETDFLYITDWREVIEAIKKLKVRGAPAIGIAGACGIVLRSAEFCFAQSSSPQDEFDFDRVFVLDEKAVDPELYIIGMDYAAQMLEDSRPTAVNLKHEIESCIEIYHEEVDSSNDPVLITDVLYEYVLSLIDRDINVNHAIGQNGMALLPDNACVLTHCNAGSLATAFYGTALGVIYSAAQEKGIKLVYSDETRPLGQGLRLTTWELSQAGIPVCAICDDMAGYVMSQGEIDACLVGADRIAANGDTANKIGTLGIAIIAKHYGIPFYVCAPTSTIDPEISDGSQIPIEMRNSEEVLSDPIDGVSVLNPAFDVTPADLISAIVTENGVFAPSDITKALNR